MLDVESIILGTKFSLVYVLILLILAVIKYWRSFKYPIILIFYVLSIISYLMYESPLSNNPGFLWVFLPPTFLLPYFFWLFTRILFEDDLILDHRHILLGIAVLTVCVSLTLLGEAVWLNETIRNVIDKVPELIATTFVFMAMLVAYSGIKTELLEHRLKFRIVFISLNSFVIILTALFGFDETSKTFAGGSTLQLIQLLMILIILSAFILYMINVQKGFFLEKEEEPVIENIDEKLQNKIEQLFQDEKIYREEGLTIAKLAEKLNEKEYIIRKVINQQMNYKNFHDFLNQYRIKDACDILSDPEKAKTTILEISYEVGFNSLAPFNRAFKTITEKTPTEFRKEKSEKWNH